MNKGTQLCSLHSLTHKNISAMFSSNKISQHNLNSNIPYRPSIVHTLHSFAYSQDRPYRPRSVQQLHCSNPQQNPLSIHIQMHYIHTYHYPPHCFHKIPSLHKKINKHKEYLFKWWQNGTRCRDGVKVLWIQFGCFLRLPSLHALLFIKENFL